MNKKGSKKKPSDDRMVRAITRYLQGITKEFEARWRVWPLRVDDPGPSEVLIGLLHRQYTLACGISSNLRIWTVDLAPILLRSMVEVHIWLAWILKDPGPRAKLFIEDGLGKEKLIIKHRAEQLEAANVSPTEDKILEVMNGWVESHMYSFLIDVNLAGSWSGLDTRKMAEEAGCQDLYRFNYPMLSSAVHSTWNHVGKYNLTACSNPLHCLHRIPRRGPPIWLSEFWFMAARYMDMTFNLVDNGLGLKIRARSAFSTIFAEGKKRTGSNQAFHATSEPAPGAASSAHEG